MVEKVDLQNVASRLVTQKVTQKKPINKIKAPYPHYAA